MLNLRRVGFLSVAALACLEAVFVLVAHGQTTVPRPSADAGLNQRIAGIGMPVQLDGSGSSDQSGRALTYLWTLVETPGDSVAQLSGFDSVSPAFTPDKKGRYLAQLVVSNGVSNSSPDLVIVTVRNTPPVANAGTDQVGAIGHTVRLDGAKSSDVDGDPLTFHWIFTSRPGGSQATLADATSAQPTFLADKPGRYVARLVVRDGSASTLDAVFIDVPNSAPTSNAGPDQSAALGTTVTVDGSGSTDIDGDRLRYAWTLTSRPQGSAAELVNPRSVTPFLAIDVPGSYAVQLVVSDGVLQGAPDDVVISTGNSAPVANAGPDKSAAPGRTLELDGGGSTDVDGNALTFVWAIVSAPDGSTTQLVNAGTAKPTLQVDRRGAYQVSLTVNDGLANSQPDIVQVAVGNTAPVADAGENRHITPGDTVTLDGSGSTDIDGDTLTYMWSLTTVPQGSATMLTGTSAIMPTFVADQPGTYVAQLMVSDGTAASAGDTVTLTTENVAPVAEAGASQTSTVGRSVQLDAAASLDVDGDPLTYRWSLTSRPDGSAAALLASTTPTPSFVPDIPGRYTAQLIVNDGVLDSAPDTAIISTINSAPIAGTGPDRIDAAIGSTIALDGSASSDADGQRLSYRWSLLARPVGSSATLDDPDAITPSFVVEVAGDYVAQLVVTDGIAESAPDTVLIRTDRIPVAVAGPDQEVSVGTSVQLDGGSSADPDGEMLMYAWTLASRPAGSTVLLAGEQTTGPSFVTDVAGRYEVTLVVTNESGESASDSVAITATPVAPAIQVPGEIRFPDTTVGSTSGTVVEIESVGGAPAAISGAVVAGDFQIDAGLSTCFDAPLLPGESCAIRVVFAPTASGARTGTLTVTSNATASPLLIALAGTGTETESQPTVTLQAGDAQAAEEGPDPGSFVLTRSGSTALPLTVNLTSGGTATSGIDYSALGGTVTIAAGQASATLVVSPIVDTSAEPDETIVLSIASGSYTVGTPSAATVVITDNTPENGTLVNGVNRSGAISTAGEVDTWTFTASAGDTIAIAIGETGGNSAFVPWIRLLGPTGALVGGGSNWGVLAAQFTVSAPATGLYTVLVASADTGNNDTGSYTLTSVRTPGAFVVSPGDEGGGLTNGGNHAGTIHVGDLDPWTFTAAAGETVIVNIGETGANSSLQPWIRIFGPTGAIVANGNDWGDLAAQVSIVAPTAGLYTVVVSTADTANDAIGTYQLTLVQTASPLTVPAGDEGGPLTNGGNHPGTLHLGDLDAWRFTAAAGETVIVNIGETGANSSLQPWIRIFGPTGAIVANGNDWGDLAAQVSIVAPTAGLYTVVVSTADTANDAIGTYQLTLVQTASPLTVPAGDEGGPLTNGGNHPGTLHLGDLDAWRFTAAAGETVIVNIGETGANSSLQPWIRIFGPTGAIVANGNDWGDLAAQVSIVAPTAGLYTVVVSTADTANDATGTYQLTLVQTASPLTVPAGDEGGPLTNGGNHPGMLHLGDLDAWRFTAAAGETVIVNIGETGANSSLQPWIRIFGPTGAIVANGNDWGDLAAQVSIVAPTAGLYTVVVSTADTANDATGTYQLTLVQTASPFVVPSGDDGGSLPSGVDQSATLHLGDLDPWRFAAVAGQRITVTITETGSNTALTPWIRVFGPTGAIVANGNDWGDVTAQVSVVAPTTGGYTIVVSTADTGNDAIGTYALMAIH